MRFNIPGPRNTAKGLAGDKEQRKSAAQNGAHPSPARMFEVASGMAEWTRKERAWLAMHPHWIEHELLLRSTLNDLKHCCRVNGDADSEQPMPPESSN